VLFVYSNEGRYTSAFIIFHVSFSVPSPHTFPFPIVAFLLASRTSTCSVTVVSAVLIICLTEVLFDL
jgi:hypothetical protein